jgi:transcriptional regulator with XRE-family HTH domain
MKSNSELVELINLIKKATGLTQEQIAERLGYTRPYLSELKKSGGNDKVLKAIRHEFAKELENLTLQEPAEPYHTSRLKKKLTGTGKRIPLYDAPAAAGIIETEMTPIHAPAGTIDVGDLLHDSQAAIRIYGNSMLPGYPPGCVVGLNKITADFIEPGEVYVIETRDRRILKRLFYRNDDPEGDKIQCISDNNMTFTGGARDGKLAYPPFLLPKSEIIALYAVTGVIKRNTNSIIMNRI